MSDAARAAWKGNARGGAISGEICHHRLWVGRSAQRALDMNSQLRSCASFLGVEDGDPQWEGEQLHVTGVHTGSLRKSVWFPSPRHPAQDADDNGRRCPLTVRGCGQQPRSQQHGDARQEERPQPDICPPPGQVRRLRASETPHDSCFRCTGNRGIRVYGLAATIHGERREPALLTFRAAPLRAKADNASLKEVNNLLLQKVRDTARLHLAPCCLVPAAASHRSFPSLQLAVSSAAEKSARVLEHEMKMMRAALQQSQVRHAAPCVDAILAPAHADRLRVYTVAYTLLYVQMRRSQLPAYAFVPPSLTFWPFGDRPPLPLSGTRGQQGAAAL